MANNFEYKIHVSIDRNSVKDDVKQALANMAKEVKNNAFQIELTGDPKNLIQQLVNLKKQVPTLDLSKGLQFNLADAIADDTEQGKKIINEFATYIINSVSEAVTSIDALSDSIKNTESALEGLKARRKNLLKDDGSADVVTAFEKAQERLEKASNKFADSKQNKGKLDAAEEIKQAYQDIINYQSEAGKEMSDKTKQILGVFAQDTAKVFKNANGEITNLAEHLKDVKVNSSYKDDLKAIESQIFENENKLTQLKKNLESAQNPELKVKGKLADNFLGDLQSQLDQMTGLEVKVKPKVDKDAKLEVEVEEDIKPIDSPNNSNNSSEIEEKKQEIKEISHDLEDVQQHINNIKPQKTQDEIRVEFEKTRNTVDQTVSSQGSYFESLFEKAKTTKLSYEEVIAVVSEAEKISSQFTKHNLELQDTDFTWADGDWEKYDIGFQGTKSDMDNFKQSLSDTYKLYKNVESAIKNNAGMYKGQFYDNSDLDSLRGIFQAIASYADELGIDINSVIESIPRMTKEFKGLAVDAVLQQKNIEENGRQYDGESEELENINSQLQERYRLLEKILTITTKDNIRKTVDVENVLSSGALLGFEDKYFQYGNVQTIVENICELLEIEIPSAAEKAKEAINEATSTPPNTSAMDTVEEELHAETQAAHEAQVAVAEFTTATAAPPDTSGEDKIQEELKETGEQAKETAEAIKKVNDSFAFNEKSNDNIDEIKQINEQLDIEHNKLKEIEKQQDINNHKINTINQAKENYHEYAGLDKTKALYDTGKLSAASKALKDFNTQLENRNEFQDKYNELVGIIENNYLGKYGIENEIYDSLDSFMSSNSSLKYLQLLSQNGIKGESSKKISNAFEDAVKYLKSEGRDVSKLISSGDVYGDDINSSLADEELELEQERTRLSEEREEHAKNIYQLQQKLLESSINQRDVDKEINDNQQEAQEPEQISSINEDKEIQQIHEQDNRTLEQKLEYLKQIREESKFLGTAEENDYQQEFQEAEQASTTATDEIKEGLKEVQEQAEKTDKAMQDIFVHFGSSSFDKDKFQSAKNRIDGLNKPGRGFWGSPENSQNSWIDFINMDYKDRKRLGTTLGTASFESFYGFQKEAQKKAEESFKFKLKEGANVLKISSLEDMGNLFSTGDKNRYGKTLIDWERAAQQYDAIIVDMEHATDELKQKLYGWDVDSIVVFNPDVVIPIQQQTDAILSEVKAQEELNKQRSAESLSNETPVSPEKDSATVLPNFESAINEYIDDLIDVESQAEKTTRVIDSLWDVNSSDSSVDFLEKELYKLDVNANPILDFIQNKADEADASIDELNRDIDNLGNTPVPTDDPFENTIISHKKSLDKVSATLPANYDGEVREQINSLYDELNSITNDDDLVEWGAKFRVVADNVRIVNDEVKNLGDNLAMSKSNYSFSLDKSLKINELNKYRDELQELGLESDDVKNRITELYNRLGSAQDKSDLGIFSKEFKLLQQEMSDVVKGKRKDNQDATSNDIKSRNKLLSDYISKLQEQAKYEEQIKALRAKGVDDSDKQITSRAKAIEEINNEIALMGELNLIEEENLNIQNRIAQARRQYAVNLQKDAGESDKQKEVNETKHQYVELLKRENELYLQNDLAKRMGEEPSGENAEEINNLQEEKEKLEEILKAKNEDVFIDNKRKDAEKARSEGFKNNAKTEETLLKRRQNLLQQITQWLKSNPIAEKKYGSGLKESIEQLNSSAKLTPKILDDIEKEFKNIKLEATKAGDIGASFGKILKQRWQSLGAYIGSFASFYQVVGYIRKMVDSVKELDSALTEMRKVSDESVSTLKAFQKESFNIADQVGSTANVIQNSTADWMRLGESLEQAKESAKDASILLNVSEFGSIDEATTALVAMSQAYKELDKMDIIDKLNNIGNNFSISTDQLASGLQNAAAVLKTQGNDIDKSIALLTAANSITQDISKASAGTRTIALRIAGTEAAKKELEELGEATDDYIVQTSSKTQETIKAFTAVASNAGRGVDVLDSNGNLRDTYDILLDISKVYKEIQEEDKKAGTNRANALVEYIAGKNRSNIAASILENPQMLEDVYKASQDSAGSAMEENAKYMDSIAGHIAQLQNQLQKLYSNTLSSDTVKGFVDFLKVIVELIDKVGVLKTAFITLGTVVGSKRLG